MTTGLVKGEGFAVDASIIEAEAGSKLVMPGDGLISGRILLTASGLVREYLEGLDNEAPGGPAFFAYSTNYLIDVAHGVIVDLETTPAHRSAEVESTKLMVDRVEANFNITPQHKDGTFSRCDFRWDQEANEYRCPTDTALRCDRRAFNNRHSRITKPRCPLTNFLF